MKNKKEFLDGSFRSSFLSIVRSGIGHSVGMLDEESNWNSIKILADEQGLSGVVLDGIGQVKNKCFDAKSGFSLPQTLKFQWIGEVIQTYELRFEKYKKAIRTLAAFYNHYGYKMMVLKGFACCNDWPNPNHRPCGDIDIWLFGRHDEANETLIRETGIKIDTSHNHHTLFNWDGVMVENHYDFVNVHAHKTNRDIEEIFKDLGKDDTHYVDVCGERIYLPSANLHALFLIRHMLSHFAAERITLRQVLDWAFFVEKHTSEIEWSWLDEMLTKYHMKEFANCINGICVEDLGFSCNMFNIVQFDPVRKDRILNDILNPEFNEEEPRFLLIRIVFKYRRWHANAWKRKLCYEESSCESFWRGVWNHLLKPASI